MRQAVFFTLIVISLVFSNCSAGDPGSKVRVSLAGGEVVQLNNEAFKKLVFNYEKNKEWKYEGTMPAIIDFYADWCAPCRQLSPLVEEIAKEYSGKIAVYKVNTDAEKLLTGSLGISSLPTLLWIPAKGKPRATLGYVSKETLLKTVNEVLLIK